MQLFILLYIEAGSYINEEEDSWEFVVLWDFSFFVCPKRVLTRLDTKSANGGRLLSQRHIISWDTRHCIPSTVFPTKSASG